MSGIGGVFNRNKKPADPHIITKMINAVKFRGPDGIGFWRDKQVALGHLLLATTPEATGETQPLTFAPAGLTITFDGRLDNRDELTHALKQKGYTQKGVTDAEIVVQAYACWREGCASRLLGDFAFAIWDKKQQQLFCARDINGIKPFYYHASSQHFIFGSELRQLVQHPETPTAINEGMVGEYLICRHVSKTETLYQNIQRLAPAHYLLVTNNRLKIERYWDIKPAHKIIYKNDRDYIDHFLELFREAVACRMRCNAKVGATLSGGIDSPFVVGMAQSILNANNSKQRLETFSVVFPNRIEDESKYIKSVGNMWQTHAHLFPFTNFHHQPEWKLQPTNNIDAPENPLTIIYRNLQIKAVEQGVKVLLSGIGADASFGGNHYLYLSLLSHLNISQIAGEIKNQAGNTGWKNAFSIFLRSIVWPLLPSSTRRYLQGTRNPKLAYHFLQEPFIQRINLRNRLQQFAKADRFADLAKWHSYRIQSGGEFIHVMETEDKSDAQFNLEQRHPFHDRRLIEFAQAIPAFYHRQKEQHKLLIRKAAKNFLPEEMRYRLNFGHFSTVFLEALMSESVNDAFHSLQIKETEWISHKKVISVYDNVVKQYVANQTDALYENYKWLWPLWEIFAMNEWYRQVKNLS